MHPLDALLNTARAAYTSRFGAPPRWFAAAPGRVNIIGEHTDYNAGLALPMAIDRWCVAVGGPSSSCQALAIDVRGGELAPFDPAVRARPSGPAWLGYVAGVFSQYERAGVHAPMNVAFTSSVPLGGGLSSSAALEVAIASLIERSAGVPVPPLERAQRCQRAEHEGAGMPCGLLDQIASIFGQETGALLIDFQSLAVTPVPLPADFPALLVINSNVRHELASGEYAQRVGACRRVGEACGVASLRELDLPRLQSARLDPRDRDCARHVIDENARTRAAALCIPKPGGARELGLLMNASHASLRDLYRVSCPELDSLVAIALDAGALGARLTGGGFGGCVLALVEPYRLNAVTRACAEQYPRLHHRPCTSFLIGPSGNVSEHLPHTL